MPKNLVCFRLLLSLFSLVNIACSLEFEVSKTSLNSEVLRLNSLLLIGLLRGNAIGLPSGDGPVIDCNLELDGVVEFEQDCGDGRNCTCGLVGGNSWMTSCVGEASRLIGVVFLAAFLFVLLGGESGFS